MNSCCFNSWKLFKKVEVIVSLISYQINTMLIKLVIRNHMILENSYYGMLQDSWISSRCCWDRHQWAHKFISSSVRWRPLAQSPKQSWDKSNWVFTIGPAFLFTQQHSILPRIQSILTLAALSPWSVQEQLHRAISEAVAGCLVPKTLATWSATAGPLRTVVREQWTHSK